MLCNFIVKLYRTPVIGAIFVKNIHERNYSFKGDNMREPKDNDKLLCELQRLRKENESLKKELHNATTSGAQTMDNRTELSESVSMAHKTDTTEKEELYKLLNQEELPERTKRWCEMIQTAKKSIFILIEHHWLSVFDAFALAVKLQESKKPVKALFPYE